MALISSVLPLLSLLLFLLVFATRVRGFMTAFTPQGLLLLGLALFATSLRAQNPSI